MAEPQPLRARSVVQEGCSCHPLPTTCPRLAVAGSPKAGGSCLGSGLARERWRGGVAAGPHACPQSTPSPSQEPGPLPGTHTTI